VAERDVVEVHDLHVWTVTSGFPALSAHVLVTPGADCHAARRRLELILGDRFDLTHTTLQVEHAEPATSKVELGEAVARHSPLRR
jgi:cobalt-zinc-cadmium efflux system protein